VNKAAYLRETLAGSPLRALSVLMGIRRDEWSRVLYYLLYPLVEPEVGSGLYIMVPQRQRSAFFSQDFLRLNRDFEPLEALRAAMGSEPLTPSKKILALYLRTYLPTLFIQEDKMSMAHSVESRTPLCDNELLELALRFPLRIKLWRNRLKALTRDVMSEKLPAVLYRLPKRGFPTPFARWYRREPLRSLMADLLFGRRTRERGMLNTAFLQRLFERNLRSRTDLLHDYARANQLYSASMVELWFRTFVDGRNGAPLELAGSVAAQPAALLTDA
jgi:asparagine synthase (glutamine-hydrolysing)